MAAYTRNQGWRPRGGKSADRRGRPTSSSPSAAFIFKDLEERVATLSVNSAVSYASELVRLRHVKPVASYSWIDAPVPTIIVPGSPWIWADERPPVRQVPLDKGIQEIHHDASKMGNDRSPLLPLFAAIDALHDDDDGKGFCYRDLDLLTDRNGLRKLLRCVDEDEVHTKDFRIDVDLVGKTVLFTRREEETTRVGENTGYGHEYVKATTRAPAGCENMSDHHRIITYKFGSLNVLMGFTADACIESKKKKEDEDEDDVLASFASLSIGAKAEDVIKLDKPSKPSPVGLEVRLSPSRTLIPQSNLIEVYLSQTAWLYMARHTSGAFEPVEKISLTEDEMKPYAEMMQGSLGKLKNLLKEILREVREQGEGVPLSLVRHGGTLLLWRRKKGSGKPLGEEIMARFKGGRKAGSA